MKTFFAKVWYAVLYFVSGVTFILYANPLTIFLFNLFFPENAASFVAEFIGFPQTLRRFYTKYALKWPYPWAKHWITLGNLSTCSARKQVAFYRDNQTYKELAKSMSPAAQVMLIRKHPEWFDRVDCEMRLTDEMFAEWMQHLMKAIRKSKPNSEHLQNLYDSLSDHLRTGKLPFSQVKMLTEAAVAEYNNSACPLMEYLLDYIERFGMSKKQLDEMAQYMCDNLYWHDAFAEKPTTEAGKSYELLRKFEHFRNILSERQINYEQRIFTRAQRGANRTVEWRNFCENTRYICAGAQKEMDKNQYKVFHATGHKLHADVIVHFLRYPDRMQHHMVFKYEPVEMFEKPEIKDLVNLNPYRRAAFDEEMACRR